ncbi:hypothetical protein [Listeria rocourtiae]|uniref:hypothetical protein n=1 Tax=Listeria rocourtiae TaxID=647910 RepID=UPI003D2F5C72
MNSYNVWLNGKKFTKYDVTFEELKTSILKRLGNINSTNRINKDKYKAKKIIWNAKTIDELMDVDRHTAISLCVREGAKNVPNPTSIPTNNHHPNHSTNHLSPNERK